MIGECGKEKRQKTAEQEGAAYREPAAGSRTQTLDVFDRRNTGRMIMGLFSRKQRVQLDAFCRDFFDRNLLNPEIAGVDVGRVYAETVRRSVSEADTNFGEVDCSQLHAEMTLIRFEMFGLAWIHQFGDKHAAAQSAYTKTYLEERDQADVWEGLTPYNQAIARSSTMGQTSDTPKGRAYLTFINTMRADLFDAWHKQGIEADAVARAANRIATDVAWEKGVTAAFVMLTLCDRLGCQLNDEGQFRLVAVIRGLYDGARETMKQVKIDA
jgi:hypothetical protein